MAIIKCPECNQEISDKAPVCPSCGVPIAGHVTTCSQCGFTYFNSNAECPQCHHKTTVDNTTMCGDESDCKVNQKASGLRNNRIVIAVVSLVVVVLGAVLYVFYRNAQSDKEESAYEFALSSNDPEVLQNYLNTFVTNFLITLKTI